MTKDFFLGVSEEGFHHIVYTEWGNPNGEPPIICVHGLTRNRHDFDSLAFFLSQNKRHVFCPDVVGRGDSDWLKNPMHYTYEQYIADMNALIAKTQAKQIDWIGTSMGGLIGMVLAAMENTPIRRLILNDIGPQISTKALGRLSKYAGNDPDFDSLQAAKNYFKDIYRDFGNLTEEQWQHLTENSVQEIYPGKFVTKLDHGVKSSPTKSKFAWYALMHPLKVLEGSLFDIDLWHLWRKIKCPVLVVHGTKSDILTAKTLTKMQEIKPDITILEVPDAGHAPALLQSDHHVFINQWLSKKEPI